MPVAHGGFGLQLGRQGLNLFNVGLTRAWRGLVDLIVLFACAPADTASYNRGTWGATGGASSASSRCTAAHA